MIYVLCLIIIVYHTILVNLFMINEIKIFKTLQVGLRMIRLNHNQIHLIL